MTWAKYFKLKDVSPVNHPFNNEVADGFDLDGITCLHGSAPEINDGLVFGSAQEIISYEPGLFYYKDTAYNITEDLVKGLNEKYKKGN